MSRGWIGAAEGFSYTALIISGAKSFELGMWVEGTILLIAGIAIAWWHHRK